MRNVSPCVASFLSHAPGTYLVHLTISRLLFVDRVSRLSVNVRLYVNPFKDSGKYSHYYR